MNYLKQFTVESYALLFMGTAVTVQRISIGAGNIFYGLSILFFLISLYKQYKNHTLKDNPVLKKALPYLKLIGLSLILILPSVLISDHLGRSFKTMFEVWVYRALPLFIIPVCVRNRRSMYWLLGAVFISLNVDSLLALFQHVILKNPRPSGFSNNPLNLAAILVMTIPVQVIISAETVFPLLLRKLSAISILTSILGLIGGQSRASWLLLAFTPFFSMKYWRKNKYFLIACIILFAIIGGYIASSPAMQNRILSTTNTTTDRSNADRIVVWESASMMIKDHPILGVGPGEFSNVYNAHYKLPEVTQNMIHTHNNFIQVTVESGVLGFLAFLILFGYIEISAFRNTLKGNPYAYIRLAATTFFLLFGLIDYTFDASAIMKLYWYYVAISLSLETLPKEYN
ncbi:MAG: O-antigen ligase family protein [Veillonella sp.]|uniref:O-antigen ligase family protein n=1 Tax=Veillonella sp. TaxID=1926307 RepID=UPI0025F613D2|nr:O-antigen ligase family protein [Veillonella sp.]MBS4913663.1 O-antigen ligase family protein [Veillonella sp.]